MSDSENDLFGDDQSSPAPPSAGAPSPEAGGEPSSSPAPQRRQHADPDEDDEPAADDGEGGGGGSGGDGGGSGGDGGDDLFGDDSDNEAPRSPRSPSTRASTPDSRRRLEYPEDEEELEISETTANLPIPTWPRLTATDGKVWHVKLPAYVNVEPRPFDPEYYRATHPDDPAEELSGPAAKGKMIGVRNTIRWRWVADADGEPRRERQTNARMLRWSDGSVSLQLGNDLFDLAPSYGTTLARPQDEGAKEIPPEAAAGAAARETSFLCVTAPEEQVLVTETAIAGQLNVVPTSMDSKTHRELVRHVGSQHEKHSRLMILDDIADQSKVAELLARAAPQRQAAIKPSSARTHTRRSVADSLGGRRGERFKREASDESDGEMRDRRRGRDRDYDEDDGFVVADSDGDDDDIYGTTSKKSSGGSGSKKKKSKRSRHHYDTDEDDDDDDGDLDAAELADRRIEAAEREKKRSKKAKSGSSKASKTKEYVTSDEEEEAADEDAEGEDDAEMDIESEEE